MKMAIVDDYTILQKVEMPPKDCLTFATRTEIVIRHFRSSIKISNPTTRVIAFKIKSTSPHLIVARPAIGYLEPKESVDLTVTADVPCNKKCSRPDRMSVLLAVCGPKQPEKASEFWRLLPQSAHCFRVVFPVKFVDDKKNVPRVEDESTLYDEKDESTLSEETSTDSTKSSEISN